MARLVVRLGWMSVLLVALAVAVFAQAAQGGKTPKPATISAKLFVTWYYPCWNYTVGTWVEAYGVDLDQTPEDPSTWPPYEDDEGYVIVGDTLHEITAVWISENSAGFITDGGGNTFHFTEGGPGGRDVVQWYPTFGICAKPSSTVQAGHMKITPAR